MIIGSRVEVNGHAGEVTQTKECRGIEYWLIQFETTQRWVRALLPAPPQQEVAHDYSTANYHRCDGGQGYCGDARETAIY